VGAKVLAPTADVLAHPKAAARIAKRGHADVEPPHRIVDDGDTLVVGGATIGFRYFGPNHGEANLGIMLPTAEGTLCYFCDLVEPNVAPYREMPDTDFDGFLKTLDRLESAGVDRILGGHAGPAEREWIGHYRSYFRDLIEATKQAYGRMGGLAPLEGEDGVAMTERVRVKACQEAADSIRSTYGAWRGFDAWAPRNADRVLTWLIIGE
jgi:glyoxylase-like metal-dependent hydrolase (beta-lactamase superfamily II)